jgi:hypothetical protein
LAPSPPFASPDPTAIPLPTLDEGESYSFSLVESMSHSLAHISITTISELETVTVSFSFSLVTYVAYEISTRTAIVVGTIVATVVDVPVYVRTVLPVKVVLIRSPTEEDEAVSAGLLLGLAGGGAAIVAVLIGIVVFIVRHRAMDTYEASDYTGRELASEGMRSTRADASLWMRKIPDDVEIANLAAPDSSDPLSAVEGEEPDDGGLYI